MSSDVVLSVSDFVGVLNQTLENAYPNVVIVGELANFKISKNRWVYFDLKDEYASVRFFGTVYMLPGPLEDGMMLQVRGNPRLHPLYGFSVSVMNIQPVGEGSLKKAAALLQAKLTAEGLFDESRKRPLPYPPQRVGLITSGESAAYADFVKIMQERWGGVDIDLADVQVQGEVAPMQIVRAIEYFNAHAQPPDVLVVTRGGGSAEDLAAFSTEQVTRAVAASRIPTIVAIGHEVDISLAELAADQRASTPSNAAQMLVPDKRHELEVLKDYQKVMANALDGHLDELRRILLESREDLTAKVERIFEAAHQTLRTEKRLLEQINPQKVLQRGYALVYQDGNLVRSVKKLKVGSELKVKLSDGSIDTTVSKVL
ncbi:MAG: exodeoxyribonuclease VII large subunit [Candidatus Saccharimonadales bacterium]